MSVVNRLIERLHDEYVFVERNPNLDENQKVENVIIATCAGCAALAATPLPLTDFFVLTPVQGVMGWRIAKIRGLDLTRSEALETVTEVIGVVGLGLLARQIVITATRLVPVFGSIASIPLVFGATYAVGRVMDLYVAERKAGRRVTDEAMRAIYASARKKGESLGRQWAGNIKRESGSATEAFMKARDEFVTEAKDAFEKTYAEFKESARVFRSDEPKPAAQTPATRKATPKKPSVKKPAAKKTVAKKPAAKKPATKKPVTKKPAK